METLLKNITVPATQSIDRVAIRRNDNRQLASLDNPSNL
jgi:hypothetical protein